ncbi:MAG: cardiolipin synthase [Burkholderiaceae bacterium]
MTRLRSLFSRSAKLLALCMLLASCASLPDIRYLNTSVPENASPTVATAKGTLPGKKAESLLAKRLRNSKTNLQELIKLEELATGSPLIAGNRVRLLFDGPQTMHAMMDAIRGAKNHVNLETYIFDQDELGMQFADLLIEKQRAGVQVNIIYDSIGTLGVPAEFFEKMRVAGISLTEFNPVNPLKRIGPWRLNNRDHRKILVVDGRVGFTGGVNIAQDYARSSLFRSKGKANAELGWRDTHIQIEGPAVSALQWLFLDAWTKQRAEDLPDREYFPRLAEVGSELVRVIASEPGSDHEIYKAYILAMQQASKSIHITVAYFVPDVQVIQALTDAARRGVDVSIVFPSISDAGLVYYAARSFYSELLAAGVKIYEFQASVLHAKTAVIDNAWSTVGSANLDLRSFLHNTEVNVVVLGTEFGNRMEAAFQEDLKNSVQISREEWEKRPFFERVKETMSRSFEYWL